MSRTLRICLALTLWSPMATWTELLDARAYYWLMTPDGTSSLGTGGLSTAFDFVDDVGYDDAEGVPGFRVVLGATHQLGVDLFVLDLSADESIGGSIRVGDRVFSVSEDISSSLEATLARAYYQLSVGSDKVRGGFLVGGQFIRLDARASSTRLGDAQEKGTAGSPVIGVHITARPVAWLDLRAELVGARWDIGLAEVTFFDLDLSANFIIPPGLLVGVGYRRAEMDADYDDRLIDVDLTLAGPVVFAGLHW